MGALLIYALVGLAFLAWGAIAVCCLLAVHYATDRPYPPAPTEHD